MKPEVADLIQQNEILRRYHNRVFPPGAERLSFLDLSCGTRTDIRVLVESLGHQWVGVDQLVLPDVVTADVHHLPFRDNVFDVVYAAATFEHYKDPWRVAREVMRVLKCEGIFCGLIAFIQPWHGDSYYHFSHLGTRQMLAQTGFHIIDIQAGDLHGIPYLMQTLFPAPVAWVGGFVAFCSSLMVRLREKSFPAGIRLLHRKDPAERDRRLRFLQDDAVRFAASIVFLAEKAS